MPQTTPGGNCVGPTPARPALQHVSVHVFSVIVFEDPRHGTGRRRFTPRWTCQASEHIVLLFWMDSTWEPSIIGEAGIDLHPDTHSQTCPHGIFCVQIRDALMLRNTPGGHPLRPASAGLASPPVSVHDVGLWQASALLVCTHVAFTHIHRFGPLSLGHLGHVSFFLINCIQCSMIHPIALNCAANTPVTSSWRRLVRGWEG